MFGDVLKIENLLSELLAFTNNFGSIFFCCAWTFAK